MSWEDEREKYLRIYDGDLTEVYRKTDARGAVEPYGQAAWGQGIIPYLKTLRPSSLCDVGGGWGHFARMVTEFCPEVFSADIAAVAAGRIIDDERITFLDAPAQHLPLADKSIEVLTCFDCLEHIGEEDLIQVFDEFKRVATHQWIFSISHDPDFLDGRIPLHLTVKPQEWWQEIIGRYGRVELQGKVPLTGADYWVVTL